MLLFSYGAITKDMMLSFRLYLLQSTTWFSANSRPSLIQIQTSALYQGWRLKTWYNLLVRVSKVSRDCRINHLLRHMVLFSVRAEKTQIPRTFTTPSNAWLQTKSRHHRNRLKGIHIYRHHKIPFFSDTGKKQQTKGLLKALIKTVITESYDIYKSRNITNLPTSHS